MTTTVIPTSAVELEEMLGDDTQLKKIFSEGILGDFVKKYAQAVQDKDANLGKQIEEQVQATLAEFLKDQPVTNRPDIRPEAPRGGNKGQYHNKRAPGAVLDGKFEDVGDLFASLYLERIGNRAGVEKMSELRNAYSTTTPSEGGFLVPEEFRAELLSVALQSAIVRPRARVIPMAVPRIRFPMIDSVSNASSVFGGIVGYWTEEAANLVASSAKFGSVTLDAQKLTGYAEIPNELLADSAISVAAFVDQLFPQALAWFEDLAFTRGTGVGEPLGWMNADATVTQTKEGSQAADTVLWANIVKMFARMLPSSLARAVWIVNQEVLPQLLQMTLPVKNVAGTENVGGSAVGIGYDQGSGAPQMQLLGRPIIVTEQASAIGDLGDISFVDLGYYLIGDRQQLTAATSEHFKFNADTTAYRVIERVDGRPWLKSPITPNKGTNTVSPFVRLEAR